MTIFLFQVTVGRQSIVTVVTRDHKGERAQCGGAEVSASISREDITKINGSGETNGTSQNGHHVNGDEAKNVRFVSDFFGNQIIQCFQIILTLRMFPFWELLVEIFCPTD